jgi:hypothetical protein
MIQVGEYVQLTIRSDFKSAFAQMLKEEMDNQY